MTYAVVYLRRAGEFSPSYEVHETIEADDFFSAAKKLEAYLVRIGYPASLIKSIVEVGTPISG